MLNISREDLELLKRELPEAVRFIEEDDIDKVLSEISNMISYYTSEKDGLSAEGKKFDRIYTNLLYDNE